jgi:hypothetical protein
MKTIALASAFVPSFVSIKDNPCEHITKAITQLSARWRGFNESRSDSLGLRHIGIASLHIRNSIAVVSSLRYFDCLVIIIIILFSCVYNCIPADSI